MFDIKRIISILLTIVLLAVWTTPGLAADGPSIFDRNREPENGFSESGGSIFNREGGTQEEAVVDASFAAYLSEVEEKYDIRITYDTDSSGNPIITQSVLSILDTSLGYVTPSVVRQVSAHFQNKNGNKLTFYFVNTPFQSQYGVEVVGAFGEEVSTVLLFLPYNSRGTFTTGASPLTIVHEFGHAVQVMCEDLLGTQTVQNEWLALNGGVGYNNSFADYTSTVFMSSYGATSYSEDFAEVFSHSFVRNRAGQGFSEYLTSSGSYTPLGNKVLYIESLLQRTMTDTQAAVSNLRRAFSTPSELLYQGLTFSGEDLQFIGFSAPRYVLTGILSAYNIQDRSSVWIRDIGGWQVETAGGAYYLVFPGANIVRLTNSLDLAA